MEEERVKNIVKGVLFESGGRLSEMQESQDQLYAENQESLRECARLREALEKIAAIVKR